MSKSIKIKKIREKRMENKICGLFILLISIYFIIDFYIWIFVLKEENISFFILIAFLLLIGILLLFYYIRKKIREKEKQRRIHKFR